MPPEDQGLIDKSNPWTTIATETGYRNKYLRVEENDVVHRSGRKHQHAAVRFERFGIAVAAIDSDGNLLLVGQYRYVLDQFTWELVRGSGVKDDDPKDVVRRELHEETGFHAEHLLPLLRLRPSSGMSDEQAPCYVAWGLQPGEKDPHPTESLVTRRIPFQDAVKAVLSGEIFDAPCVATILALNERLRSGELPESLVDLLKAN